jgi:hypothetical protein
MGLHKSAQTAKRRRFVVKMQRDKRGSQRINS